MCRLFNDWMLSCFLVQSLDFELVCIYLLFCYTNYRSIDGGLLLQSVPELLPMLAVIVSKC